MQGKQKKHSCVDGNLLVNQVGMSECQTDDCGPMSAFGHKRTQNSFAAGTRKQLPKPLTFA